MNDTYESKKRSMHIDEDERPAKRLYSDSDLNVKILVPSLVAGSVIGKGGSTIVNLQKDCGSRIKMSRSNECFPGTTDRTCLITGDKEAILRSFNQLLEKLLDSEHKRLDKDGNRVRILIPNSTAGIIIGKSGATIKSMKETSDANIIISSKDKYDSPERVVSIIGETESIQGAMELILDKISDDPQSGSHANFSYADRGSASISEAPPRDMFSSSGVLPGGSNLSRNLIDAIFSALRQAGYQDKSIERVIAAFDVLAGHKLIGIDSDLQGTFIGVNAPLGRLPVETYGRDSFNFSRDVDSYSSSRRSRSLYDNDKGDYKSLSPSRGRPGIFGEGPRSGPPIKEKELEVPDDMIAVILGRGGHGLMQIRERTGANVQVSKKGVYCPGTKNRLMTITGTNREIEAAEVKIRARMEIEEERRRQNMMD